MPSNYIKEKYMEHAPKWEIEGHTTTPVRDEHYMPENADRVEEEDTDVPLLMKCLAASLVCAVVLAAVVYWVYG